MKKSSGFTLIELMIVVAIIAVIAAIAVPSLLRSRIGANEAASIGACRTLCAAQTAFHASNNYYGTLGELFAPPDGVAAPYIDDELAAGTKDGYDFAVAFGDNTVDWNVLATPVSSGKSGIRTFYSDESGIVREDGPAGPPV